MRRRAFTLADLNILVSQHDHLISTLAPDHVAAVLAVAMMAGPVAAWRAARANRARLRALWESLNDALQEADTKADGEARKVWLRTEANHGAEGVALMEQLANQHKMGQLIRMPIDRALVVYADLFAAIDALGPSAKIADTSDLRAAVDALRAASETEGAGKADWIAAGATVDSTTAALATAATRFSLALESAVGVDEAARLFPPLPTLETTALGSDDETADV